MISAIVAVRRIAVFFDRLYWVWLILAAPFLLFPNANRSPALLIVPVIWLFGWIANRTPVRRTPFNLALLLMFVMVLVSEWATYDLAFSLPKIAGMVLGAGIFFAVVRVGENKHGWQLGLAAFVALELAATTWGFIGTKWLYKVSFLAPITSRLPARIKGLPGAEEGLSANELAGTLLWVLPLLIILLIWLVRHLHSITPIWGNPKTKLVLGLVAGATCFISTMLILTQSRSAYIGLVVGLGTLIFLMLPRQWQLGIGTLGVVGLLVVGVLYQGRDINNLAESVLGGPNADPALSLDTLEGRVEVWARAVYGIQDFPFTGMGMNTFRKVVTVLYPLFLVSPDYDIAHAHNEFLQAALDLGIPGLIALVAIYLITLWMLIQIWRGASQSSNGSLLRALVLGFGGGLLAHLVYGMTDAVTLGAKPGAIFWMMLGLIAALYEQVRTRRITEWEMSRD